MTFPMRAVGVVSVLAALQPAAASAALLQFVPAAQVTTGSASVDIVIAELLTEVGGFDVDVSFDPTILSPTGVVFAASLGDIDLGEATNTFTFLPNTIGLTSLSFLSEAELDPLQPDSFALATIMFNTLSEGTGPLTFVQSDLVDTAGQPIAVTLLDGSVTKVIPEPGTLMLLGSALALWTLRRRRPRSGCDGVNCAAERHDL